MHRGRGEIAIPAVEAQHLVIDPSSRGRTERSVDNLPRPVHHRHVTAVEADLHPGPTLIRRVDQPGQLLRGNPGWLFHQQRKPAREHLARRGTGDLGRNREHHRIRLLGREHRRQIGVVARIAERAAIVAGAIRVDVAACGQRQFRILRGTTLLDRTMKLPGKVPTADHAEFHAQAFKQIRRVSATPNMPRPMPGSDYIVDGLGVARRPTWLAFIMRVAQSADSRRSLGPGPT